MARTKKLKMTREEANQKLLATRVLSTDLLEPLGVSMETFLRLAQMPKEKHDQAVEGLLKRAKLL